MPDSTQVPPGGLSPGGLSPGTLSPGGLSVRHGTAAWQLGPRDELTFGRDTDCTVALAPEDVAISRRAGRVSAERGLWWVVNTSTSRALAVVDEFGLRAVLPPGHRRAVEGHSRVLVEGAAGVQELILVPADARTSEAEQTAAHLPSTVGVPVLVNDADRAALVALFAGYLLEGPRYDPNPKSYAAAAARLGWPRTTLVKRIEYLRARLSAAGVPNLNGPFALNNLAEYALTTGLVSQADLGSLRDAPG